MADRKSVRQNTTRRSATEKLNDALAKKPTASFLNSRGLPVESNVSEGKERLIQRKVRNAKNAKRITNRPVTGEPTFDRTPFQPPTHKVIATPDWFGHASDVDVSVVVPCFKSQDYIREQIASWDLADDGLKKEIIYVDDACPGKSHNAIIEAWSLRKDELTAPVGKIVLNARNGGFACACNTGAVYAKGKYLVFLNADTAVTPNWVRPMYDAIQDDTIGLVGNMQLRKDGTIDSCGSEWDWKSNAFLHVGRHIYQKNRLERPFTLETIPSDLLVPHDVEMVTGACLMISRPLFDKIGGFDTQYRIGYWEDTELNMRVHSHGYRVHFTPDSRIYHKVGHTNSGAHAFASQNQHLFRSRWVDTRVIEGYLNGRRPDLKPLDIDKDKVVVYTAITGDYDALKEQRPSARGVEYVAFTEQPFKSDTWTYRPVHAEFKDPNRNAKIHKVMPHLYFPDKEYSLWIDGSVRIEFPFSIERLIEIYLADCDLALFKHPDRNCIFQEANTCINRKLDDAEVIRRQVQRYTKDGYPANVGLCECTILLRRHTPQIQKLNELWWDEISNGSRRDQISFNYVARKLGVKYRFFPGDLRKQNYLFKRELHKRGRR